MSNLPIHLSKGLDGLGRTHGSSATPVQPELPLLSPQPQRDIQTRIDNLSNEVRRTSINQGKQNQTVVPNSHGAAQIQSQGSNHHRNQSSSTRSGVSNRGNSLKFGNHSRHLSSSTRQSGFNQEMGYTGSTTTSGTFKFPTEADTSNQGNSKRITVSELSAAFQTKLMEVQQTISRKSNIPNYIQEFFTQELQKISQEFNEQQRRVQQEFDRLKNERDNLRRQLQASKADNNRLLQERRTLELRHQKSSERMEEVESRWKRVQEDLLEQIAVQKEQLAGKRALWMKANPGSSARRDAMTTAIRDPFNSPTANQTPSYAGSVMGSMISPSVTSPPQSSFGTSRLGPPPRFPSGFNADAYMTGGYNTGEYGKATMSSGYNVGSSSQNRPNPPPEPRKGTMPTGRPVASAFMPETPSTYNRLRPTEPRSDQGTISTALVLHKGHEQLAAEYKAAISKLYDLVEDWVLKYANEPCQKNDRAIASSNDILWDYMMNCTYPGHRQDAHTHVVTLLGDSTTRYWFIMRMATEYCVMKIMSIEAFKPYSKSVDKIIAEMLLKLKERGLNNEARQQYIDKGSRAVQSVVAANDYQNFRADQLNDHTKELRDILGPMLNDGVARSEAGKDLGAIAIHSWELSVKMHTAGLTFQIYFPETASKFTAATMKSKDRPYTDPMQLQVQQIRLKLVITPVITMRDDKGTTIKAKAVHSANVLLMS